MKVRVRRVAIVFALGSAIYWETVSAILGLINPLAGHDVAPYWMVALANSAPAALYAVAALTFCHWLSRSLLRQVQKGSDT